MSNTKKTINDQIKAIEDILNQLESGDSTIEESIELYKSGKKILKACTGMISTMEKELTIVSEEEMNEALTRDLDK